MNATKYSMEATYEFKEPSHRRTSSRHSHHTDDDGNGSLTYSSAASSANSATGESTDSSFADIMKVLDGQESSKDIALYLQQKEMVGRARHDEKSVADSLAYSTDADTLMGRSLAYSTDADTLLGRSLLTEGESHYLHGTDLLSTVTGQPSDQYADDHALHRSSQPNDGDLMTDNIMFSPAEHTDSLKRRKERKKLQRLMDKNATPRATNASRHIPSSTQSQSTHPSNASTASTKSSTQPESRQGTPPACRPPKAEQTVELVVDEEDVWYAKWWMFCFPETVKSMSPKR